MMSFSSSIQVGFKFQNSTRLELNRVQKKKKSTQLESIFKVEPESSNRIQKLNSKLDLTINLYSTTMLNALIKKKKNRNNDNNDNNDNNNNKKNIYQNRKF